MFNMLVTANRTFPVIIIMLTCVAANRANTRRRVVSMPRSIGISANFASMRTLVLMRRMLVSAYRANSVFVIMFGRFISNAASLANVFGGILVTGMLVAADSAGAVFVIMRTFFAAHGAFACCGVVIVRGHGITANSADMRTFVIVRDMFMIAYRANAVLVFMLTCVAANRADPRFGIESVPRSIGISADFASMRTLVLMRRMLVIAYRAHSVFIDMFGRFMSNAADFADMCGIVFVTGMLITAYRASAVVVIMHAFFATHGTLTRCRVVIVRIGNKVAYRTLVRAFENMRAAFMRRTANGAFVGCAVYMLVIVGHGRVFRKRIRQCGTVRRDEPAAAETCDGFGDVPGAYAFAAAADRYTVHQTVAEE